MEWQLLARRLFRGRAAGALERRVLRRLLEVSEAYGGASPGTVIPLTQEQLAALVGTSRATVNAVLSAERERGTLSLGRGRTTLTDPAALAHRAGVAPGRT